MKLTILLIFCFSFFISNTALANKSEISKTRQKELFHIVKQDCGSCHGMTLKGGLGTSILPEDLVNKPVNFLTYTIMNGRPGTAMPPWKAIFSQSEAKWIAQQLKQGNFK